MTEHFITLSTTEPNNYVGLLKMRQGDTNTQEIEATITANGQLFKFDNLSVFFNAVLPNGNVIRDKVTNVDYANSKLNYIVADSFLQEVAQVTAWFSFENGEKIIDSTKNFQYSVIPGWKECIPQGNYIYELSEIQREIEEIISNKDFTTLLSELDFLKTNIAYLDNNIKANVAYLDNNIKTNAADLNNSINDKLSQISSVPETFANLAALKSTYPNGKTGLFVTADTGHKYIWANSTWTDAGVYQSAGLADASVTGAKLDPKIRGLGANIGIAYPTKIQHLEPNTLEDPTPTPPHFKYLVDFKIYNPDPTKAYFIYTLGNDNVFGYGAIVGYLPKTNGTVISTVGAKLINSKGNVNPLAENQDGFVTSVINYDKTQICVTYDQRQMTQDNINRLRWVDFDYNRWYDCCLIDDACYVGNDFIRPFSQLYNQRIEPNNQSAEYTITQPVQQRYVIKKILVVNPEPNKLYFVEKIYNGGDDAKWGVTFGTFDNPDNNDVASVDTRTAKLLTPTQLLTDKPVVSADGLVTQSLTYQNTTIIITYDTTKLDAATITYFADINLVNYFDNCIIDRINYINLAIKSNVKFNKPAWLGDSITEINDRASIHYHEILSANWGSVRSENLGVGGSTVGNQYNPMSERYVNIPADADFISVFGGINDYGRNQPLGQYGDTTNATFYGGLYVLLNGLQTQFPTVPKIFISPMHIGSSFGGDFTSTVNGLGLTQDVYEQAIVEMTRKFGIPHLSLFSDMGVTFAVKAQSDYYSADSLHPNNAGQALIAEKILNFLK